MRKKLYIIDYMSITHRMYWAFEKYGLQNERGEPTSALFGVAGFLLTILKDNKPDYIVAAKESSDGTSWRKDMYALYKSNRSEKPVNLVKQYPEIDKFYQMLGIPMISAPSQEADDIVGSLVKQYSDQVDCMIVSSDKDFMQLISPTTSMYIPQNGGGYIIANEQEVLKKFDCTPDKVRSILALMGDTADCVPGAKGIGPKGAAKLIKEWGSLQNVYCNLDTIKKAHSNKLRDSRMDVAMSYKLVGLNQDIDLGLTLEDMVTKPLPGKSVYEYLLSHNMNSVASEYFEQVWEQLKNES